MTYNSMKDIENYISDQPLDDVAQYSDDYVETVSGLYYALLETKGWSFGEELPEVTEDEFWDLFKYAEKL